MHPNEELARREFDAWKSDPGEAQSLYADDSVLHFPGNNPLAGDYKGKQGLKSFAEKQAALIGGGIIYFELHDAFGSDEHAVELVQVEAERGGKRHRWSSAVIMHVRDGKITEAWVQPYDQHALDAFLS